MLFALIISTTAKDNSKKNNSKDNQTAMIPESEPKEKVAEEINSEPKEKIGAEITFEKTTHSFGSIKEEDGKVTYVFKFINTGDEPLILSKVLSSCGCTAPTFTKEPVAPKGKGEISVTFNPKGRPGGFSKHLVVYANINSERCNIYIKGNVIPAPKQ